MALFILLLLCVFLMCHKQKYGLIAAVKLEDIKTMVSNYNDKLVNEKDNDITIDYDPTQQSSILTNKCTVAYKQVFSQTMRFINDNNHVDRPYLQYPKLYLQCKNNVKCNNQENCKECCNKDVKTISIFGLCLSKRREIGDEMYDCAREQKCITDSLTTTAAKLFISSESLIKDSNEYTLNSHWFAKIYSFLKCYQETITISLHDLVNENMRSNQINEHEEDDDAKKQKKHNKQENQHVQQENEYDDNQFEESAFLFQFDFLTSLHSYLDKLIEYLVLYYCCFDTQSWIAVFYPFIQAGIGTYNCKMLFAQSNGHSKQVTSLFNQTESIKEEMDRRENILKEIKVLNIFNRLICDTLSANNNNNNDENNSKIVNYVLLIKNKLGQMVDNIESKSKNSELQLQALAEMEMEMEIESAQQQLDGSKIKLGNGAQFCLCDLEHKNVSNIFKHLIMNNNSQSFSVSRKYHNVQKPLGKRKGKRKRDTNKHKDKIRNEDIYYHYFDKNELKSVLKSIECDHFELNDDLINIICEYYCITQWSKLSNEKSKKISTYNSNDNMISYAICNPNNDDSELGSDTILLNTIIDKKVKSIYRFMFKNVLINNNDATSFLRIGILTKNFNELNTDRAGDSYIGCDEESICWSYYNYGQDGGQLYLPGECAFIHDGMLSPRIELNMNDSQSIDSYFLIEINLSSKKFRVFLPAFDKSNTQNEKDNDDKDDNSMTYNFQCMEFDIPKKIANEKNIRIGVTIDNEQPAQDISNDDIDTRYQYKYVGLGLVRNSI